MDCYHKMGFLELLILGIGLSMDAFAVSVCKGLSLKKINLNNMLSCGFWFGGFQALMPLIGFLLGSLFAHIIVSFDHWVAFGLLLIIGLNMIKEALFENKNDNQTSADMSIKEMFMLAVATSIDALAIGISLAMLNNVNIWIAISIIGCTTFILSVLGVKIGSIFGNKFEQKAQITGGIILILLGIKILIEHL